MIAAAKETAAKETAAPTAEEAIVKYNRLLWKCVKKAKYALAITGNEEDVYQMAVLGLLDSLRTWKPGRGASLLTYLHFSIPNRIHTEIRRSYTMLRIPDHIYQKSHPHYDRWSEQRELAEKTKVVHSINKRVAGRYHDHMEYHELFPDPHDDIAEADERMDWHGKAAQLLRFLSPKEQHVVRLKFGIGYSGPATLEAIGDRMGFSKEWARQIVASALAKLRRAAGVE